MSDLFTADERARFDAGLSELLSHYPADRKRAAMLPVLRLVQSLKGWIPPEAMKLVAEKLETTPERVLEVATFYVMFHTQKPGKYVIDVCTNLSCSLRGAEGMLAYLERRLGTKAGTTATSTSCARPSVSPAAAPRRACRSTRTTTRTSTRRSSTSSWRR